MLAKMLVDVQSKEKKERLIKQRLPEWEVAEISVKFRRLCQADLV
jgi:hypothetical protein